MWLLSGKRIEKPAESNSCIITAMQIALALSVSLAAENYKPAHDNVLLFYTIGFIKHCLTVMCIVAGISLLFDRPRALKERQTMDDES